ncbi:UNVERIFIED_CONTAM: hypothetical protein Sradi_2491400 [Sesamum radiatum]|uniref:Uncharacterized protein n=1 Tax=Sesamum radiatum TaxID=300843 RepID=A0AAW2SLU5_SESRA
MDLNWCKFYVHVHDLPMSRMNLGIATFIGNKLGKFHDSEMDSAGCAWGATLRMNVTIDKFTYERPGLSLWTMATGSFAD